MTVYAISEATTNAELIRDAAILGYLPEPVCDPTYGLGRFWTLYQPDTLVASDIDPERSPVGSVIDFTKLPWGDNSFGSVVFDPPYKMNGTPSHASDPDYGVGERASIEERMRTIRMGLNECVRVCRPGGYILVKCQDQVSSGRVQWQTFEIKDWMDDDCTLVDSLLLVGSRPQPAGRSQKHARRNYSTLMIFRKDD